MTKADETMPAARQPSEVGRSQVTLKTVFVVLFAFLLVAAGAWAVAHARVALVLTATAGLLAVALDHAVRRVQRMGVGRGAAIAVVVLLAGGVLALIGFIIVPAAISQATGLIKAAPAFAQKLRDSPLVDRLDAFFHVKSELDDPGKRIAQVLQAQAAPLLVLVGGFLSLISGGIVIAFLTIFMLIFGGGLVKAALAEARVERRPMYEDVITKIHQAIGGYVIGLAIICSVNAALTTTFLAVNRTPFFLPLGILSGFSSLVPYAGPIVAGLSISSVALATGGWAHGIASGIYFVIYGQIEGNILSPLVFRRTVHANPLLVTLSILFLAEIGGVFGAVVAVPALAIVQIGLAELLSLRRDALARRAGVANSQPPQV